MAEPNEQETPEAPEAEAAAPARKPKALKLGVGAAIILALAFAAVTLGVPGEGEARRFAGPFVVPLFEEKVNSNLAEEGRKRFLQMNMNVVYDAYEEAYVVARIGDPLYMPFLRDAVLRVNITKNVDQVFDRVSMSTYLEEIREAVEPILFPVHVGDTARPTDRDPESGLTPGLSMNEATFRGALDEHVLVVDAVAGTLRLGEGPETAFEGGESDLEVRDERGRTLYLDVTSLEEGFRGEVPVGVKGRVRRILCQDFLVQ
jgi:hypothetical protein